MPITYEDAIKLLIRWLRQQNHGGYGSYGYEIYLPALLRGYLETQGIDYYQQEKYLQEMIPVFYDVAWDLCRRGILRPGVRGWNEQATADGASGNGYSITPFGKKWLSEADRDDFVPTEPERFAQMLAPFQSKFGPSFQERSQEAVRCYGAHACLACCAMCGAAAESILLGTAISKTNETAVLPLYNQSSGRRRVENLILGQVRKELREEHLCYMSLLKYWKDQASHGKAANISDNEAYTAIALLLRFALFVNDNWSELTS
jgi:hypothetical protein